MNLDFETLHVTSLHRFRLSPKVNSYFKSATPPIEVKRVYDSLQSNQIGDFGYGWNLGVQDARITESVPITDPNGFDLFLSTPFQVGSTVTLTNPFLSLS